VGVEVPHGVLDRLLAITAHLRILLDAGHPRPAAGQLERYLRSFDRHRGRGGLILLERQNSDVPRQVTDDRRWLGQIRWDQLIPRLGAIAPNDAVLAEQWRLLIALISRPGDLAEQPLDWTERRGTKAGQRNAELLRRVRDEAVTTVRRGLLATTTRGPAERLCAARPRKGTRSVRRDGTTAFLSLYVPAEKGRDVVEIELSGSRAPLKVATAVDPGSDRRRGRTRRSEAIEHLKRSGFALEQESGWFVVRDAIGPEDGDAPEQVLSGVVTRRLDQVLASGVLEPLAR
jgi:hypothetical protein